MIPFPPYIIYQTLPPISNLFTLSFFLSFLLPKTTLSLSPSNIKNLDHFLKSEIRNQTIRWRRWVSETSDKYKMINFEETELRLGLPGACGNAAIANDADCAVKNSNNWCTGGKRGFSDTTVTVDLKLNLSSSSNNTHSSPDNLAHNNTNTSAAASASASPPNDPAKPPAKAQVVGWPPVRSFRKNMVRVQKKKEEESLSSNNNKGATLVKVSMDGAPYLRKVDLKMYKSYQQLSDALANMFSSFTSQSQGITDFINQTKLLDLFNGSDYVPTYQDNDRDWMLLGDVPWDMFVESCKRIRIMKGSEAIGLAPKAVEKCKNRI